MQQPWVGGWMGGGWVVDEWVVMWSVGHLLGKWVGDKLSAQKQELRVCAGVRVSTNSAGFYLRQHWPVLGNRLY